MHSYVFVQIMKDEKGKSRGQFNIQVRFQKYLDYKEESARICLMQIRLRINEKIFHLGFTGFHNHEGLYFSGNELSEQGWLSDLLQILFYTNIRNWSETSSRAGFLPTEMRVIMKSMFSIYCSLLIVNAYWTESNRTFYPRASPVNDCSGVLLWILNIYWWQLSKKGISI